MNSYHSEAHEYLKSAYFPETIPFMGPYFYVRGFMYFLDSKGGLYRLIPSEVENWPLRIELVNQF